MPRNYQQRSDKEYILPHNVYMQMLYIIKDYDRLIEEKEQILFGTPPFDGQPRGTDISRSTEIKAEKLSHISDEINAIDQTCVEMIGKYSKRTDTFKPLEAFDNCNYFSYQMGGYAEITWKKYRQRFAYKIAEKLKKV